MDVEHTLRSTGVARAVQGSLLAAAGLAAALALIGVAVSMLPSPSDSRVSDDLDGQGIGPRARRSELRLRSLLTGLAGSIAGLVIAPLLTPMAVQAVRASSGLTDVHPPPVAITPWGLIGLWCLGMGAAALLAGTLGVLARPGRGSLSR